MKTIWFKKAGILYLPVHFMGYLLTMLAIGVLVPVSLAVVRQGRPVS
jgi:hypothetical protein